MRSVMAHGCSSCTGEAEAGWSTVQAYPRLYSHEPEGSLGYSPFITGCSVPPFQDNHKFISIDLLQCFVVTQAEL